MTVIGGCFNHHKDAAFVFLNHRKRATGSLQQRLQLCFYKSVLLVRIAHVAQRWTHVERAARLALEQHIIATQMDLGSLSSGAQLLQVTVAKLSLFVFLVANSLRICYPLGDWRGRYSGSAIAGCRISSCHGVWTRVEIRIVHDKQSDR